MHRLGVWAAIALLSLTEGVSIRSAVAQTVPPTLTATCVEHQMTVLEQMFFTLSTQVEHDLKYQRVAQASENVRRLLLLSERYPEANWIALRLSGLVSDDSMASEPSQWQRLIAQSLAQGIPSEIFSVLSAAVDAAETLDSGYSFLKANTLRAIAHAYGQFDRPDLATATLQLALEATSTIQGAEFKANALIPIADIYAQLGDLEQAQAVLQQALVQANAVEHPDDPSRRDRLLSLIAMTYAEIGALDAAQDIAQSLSASSDPQGTAFLAVVNAYLTNHQPDQGERIAQTIPHLRYRAIALKDIAQYYQTQAQPDRVDPLFQRAIEAAQQYTQGEPSDWEYTLAQVIEAYGQWQPAAALPLAQAIQDTEKRADLLTSLTLSFQAQGQTAAAQEVLPQAIAALQQVSTDWQGMLVYRLVEKAIAAESYDLALQLSAAVTDPFVLYDRTPQIVTLVAAAGAAQQFEAAQRALATLPVDQPALRSPVLAELAVAYINAHQTDAAMALVDQIDPAYPVHRVRVLGAIARQLLRTGNTDPAFAVFDQAQQIITPITTPSEKIEALGLLLVEYAEARQPLDADLLRQLDEAMQAEDASVASTYGHRVVEQLMMQQHWEAALQVAARLPETSYYRTSALEGVSRLAFEADRIDLVMAGVDALTDPAAQIRLLQPVVDRALYNSDPQTQALLQRMVAIAQTMPDPESRQLTFGNEGGTVVEDEFDRASTYEAIALRYGLLGQQQDALRIAGLIQDGTLRDRLTQRLGCLPMAPQ